MDPHKVTQRNDSTQVTGDPHGRLELGYRMMYGGMDVAGRDAMIAKDRSRPRERPEYPGEHAGTGKQKRDSCTVTVAGRRATKPVAAGAISGRQTRSNPRCFARRPG